MTAATVCFDQIVTPSLLNPTTAGFHLLDSTRGGLTAVYTDRRAAQQANTTNNTLQTAQHENKAAAS